MLQEEIGLTTESSSIAAVFFPWIFKVITTVADMMAIMTAKVTASAKTIIFFEKESFCFTVVVFRVSSAVSVSDFNALGIA